MIQAKVTTIGNSLGMVLPKELLHKLHLHKGDSLYLYETPDGYMLSPYDATFIEQMKVAEGIMHEDRDVLKILAKR